MATLAFEDVEHFVFPGLRLSADGEQETPYLRLEDDDERDETHTDKSPEDRGEEFHLEGVYKLPDEEDGDNAYENTDGSGAFQ